MKIIAVPLFTLIVASGFIAGCASHAYETAADTANTLKKSSDLVTRANSLIDASMAKLNDLVSNPNPDLRDQFKAFSSSVTVLGATADDVDSKAEQMKSQGGAYFARWDQEMATIQNEDIRNRSETRKSEVEKKFSRISQSYLETKLAFQPFISDLRDVQKFLGADLTVGGLASIKEVAAKATQDASALKEPLSKLSDEFKDLGLSLSPTAQAR